MKPDEPKTRIPKDEFPKAVDQWTTIEDFDDFDDNCFMELELPITKREEFEEAFADEASWKELVQQAYRKKALLYHPDKNQGGNQPLYDAADAAALFRRAGEARDLLKDVNKARDMSWIHLRSVDDRKSSVSRSPSPPLDEPTGKTRLKGGYWNSDAPQPV